MATIAELFDLALRHHQSGDLAQAESLYGQVLQLDPAHANALFNLGSVLKNQGRSAEAAERYRHVLQSQPHHAGAYNNLGNALRDVGRLTEAEACYRQALRINPQFADAYFNLGNALGEKDDPGEADDCYRQALRFNPRHAPAYLRLGNSLRSQGRFADAEACYRQAIALNPADADAYNNLGAALLDQVRLTESAEQFEQALLVQPGHETTLWNRSLLRLLQGDFKGGWPDYEYRWSQPGFVLRHLDRPRWDGSNLAGKTILIHAEQGLGDTLQFVRYVPLIKERGGVVLFESPPTLLKMLTGACGIDRVFATFAQSPGYDVQVPLHSLPGIFGTSLATVPADVPYLRSEPDLVERWRRELEPIHGFKVGVVWQGDPKSKINRYRSVPLAHFEPLSRVPGVRLVSLQIGLARAELSAVPFPVTDLGGRFDVTSLTDVAAVLTNLDLVVTVETAVAHLAGALAVPVWTVLSVGSDWRWLLERADSPWYPTMRLFRQHRSGDWAEVFERLAAELRAVLASRGVNPPELA